VTFNPIPSFQVVSIDPEPLRSHVAALLLFADPLGFPTLDVFLTPTEGGPDFDAWG
jgi:hypothetical protein